jgi:hypothetical protein
MNMRRENIFLWKVIIIGAAIIIVFGLLFFNFKTMTTWMTLNDPFQGQWAVVQLSNGEILYGHLSGVSGSTIGLENVYLLDKVSPATETSIQTVSSSTGLSMIGVAPGASAAQQPTLIPISDTPELFINRSSVLYFKFVAADDPALPYLH